MFISEFRHELVLTYDLSIFGGLWRLRPLIGGGLLLLDWNWISLFKHRLPLRLGVELIGSHSFSGWLLVLR